MASAPQPTQARVAEKSAAAPALTLSISPPNTSATASVINTVPVNAPVDRKEHVARLTKDMFSKIADYLRGELLTTSDDYRLLEMMNNVTREKYSDMSILAQTLMGEMSKVQETYASFAQYIAQIDEVTTQVDYLEQVANELDDYSKYLEAKVKTLIK